MAAFQMETGMTLISLLLVLALERVTTGASVWQSEKYTESYWSWLKGRFSIEQSIGYMWVGIIIPVVLVLLVQENLSGFWRFLLGMAVLMICVGCPKQRGHYKGYLQAANRGDMQACSLYADEMGHDEGQYSFGQTLVWVNFQHYAAVVLWFVALGPAGAVLYILSRAIHLKLVAEKSELSTTTAKLMHGLDWLPVRVAALGFLLVGHFSRALPVWLSHLLDVTQAPRQFLSNVAKAAEEVEPDEMDCTEEPCTMVRLAKRNLVFLLVVISILTLSGFVD